MNHFSASLPVICSGPPAQRMMTKANMAAIFLGPDSEPLQGLVHLTEEHFKFLADTDGDGTCRITKALKIWVRDVILPAIFTQGGYILPEHYEGDPDILLLKGLDVAKATAKHLMTIYPEAAEEYGRVYGMDYRRTLDRSYRHARKALDSVAERSFTRRKAAKARNAREEAAEQRRLSNETRMLELLTLVYSGEYRTQLEVLAALPFPCTPGTLSKLKRKAIRKGLITGEKWAACLSGGGGVSRTVAEEEA